MANHKRTRPRTKSGLQGHKALARKIEERGESFNWAGRVPSAWNILFHSRPWRRETTALEHAVLRGADPDAIAWPLGRKPCVYSW